jgi:hypothetical protein
MAGESACSTARWIRCIICAADHSSHFRQVAITLEGDEAGRNAATEMATRRALGVWVRIADVAGGTQPDRPIKRPCAADCVGIFYH